MTLDTTQVPLIAFLAVVFTNALIVWYLIYARAPASVAVGPPAPRPVVPGPGPVPEPPAPGPGPAPEPPKPVPAPAPPPAPAPAPPVAPVPAAVGSDFDRCLAVTLKWEGGNDDDPRDSGGRTSRGITAADWAAWRETHPGLPADVWQAPQAQIAAIYREMYWNKLYCDSLPSGVDLVEFDHGVLGGIGTSAKLLQRLVGTDVDGEIGPLTIAAAAAIDPVSLVGQFCDARLAYYQSLNRPEYIKGWTNRVLDVRKEALALATEAPRPKVSASPPSPTLPTETSPKDPSRASPTGIPPWLTLARSLVGTHATNDNAVIIAWPSAIAAKFPDMADYCARYVHDSIPWCGLTVAYVLAMSGVRPQYGATDTDKFLWADAWRQFGTAVDTPQPGDILVFKWAGGGEHVTLYDHEEDDDYYHCTGGNQGSGHVVSTEAMPMANCIAIRRPS